MIEVCVQPMIEVCVQTGPFDTGAAIDRLTATNAGAVASFVGAVRGVDDLRHPGRKVVALELEHYPAMTGAALRTLADEAAERWTLTGCILVHRIGRLETGEPIVLAAAAAAHRAQALDACAFLIDRLKTDAPFWKKQHFDDGSAKWVEAKEGDNERAERWG